MKRWDFQNLICMWDESLLKVIDHLENGRTERALMRTKEMHKAITKLRDHCQGCDRKIVDDI